MSLGHKLKQTAPGALTEWGGYHSKTDRTVRLQDAVQGVRAAILSGFAKVKILPLIGLGVHQCPKRHYVVLWVLRNLMLGNLGSKLSSLGLID